VDIPTQVADDIPMQPQQSNAEDDGADGKADIGQNTEEDAGAAGGGVLIDVVGGNNGGNKDRPPHPNRYGDDDSDILGPDYSTVLSVMLNHVCGCSLVLTSSSTTGFITSK
jgi:hypothetical protein